MAGVALVAALLLSLPFLFVLARRPILRRLALRNAARRPREALLVVVGSMMGAAIITGSFVVGDTLNASIRQAARTHLGPVDEIVLTRDATGWLLTGARLTALPERDVDGLLQLQTIDAAMTSGAGGARRTAPRSQVVGVDFPAARRFGGDPGATGIEGPTPGPFHAAITTDLARALDAGPGDTVDIYAYGKRTRLAVDRILPRWGIAGFWLGTEQEARNLLVSPLTFARLTAPSLVLAERFAPPNSIIAVSNRGGVMGGAELSDRVQRQIEARVQGLGGQVIPAKQLMLDAAEQGGKGFTDLFTGMGSFGVLAGVLLLVNLFVMLAAERKPELGMARAVGMRRSWLVGAFATEGWLYALVASLLGAVCGIGLGRVIIAGSQRMFSTEHNRFDLFFTVKPASIALGFAIGFLIALFTVLATSIRVSRLNIIRAIRDLAEPPKRSRRRWLVVGAALVLLGGLWTITALPKDEPFGLLLGPMLALAGLGPLLARSFGKRNASSLLSLLVIAWGVSIFVLLPDAAREADMMVWVAQGVTLTAAAVTLFASQQERLALLIRRVRPGRRLALRLGLAYPLARRSRTALTVAMYGLVIFILTFITTFAAMIGGQSDRAGQRVAGGFDVVASSSSANPLPMAALAARPGAAGVAPLSTVTVSWRASGGESDVPWRLTAFDRRLIDLGAPSLNDRGPYPSDRAAWLAVLSDPSLIVVNESFLQTSGGPGTSLAEVGDRYTLIDPVTNVRRAVTVAGLVENDMLINNGAFYGEPGARKLLGPRLVPERAYVVLAPGIDADRWAASVQGAYFQNGAEVSSISALMDEAFSIWDAMFQLFQGYLALGLVVGIAGLAVVMVRSVRERRRQIGMLRALGFGGRTVGRSFAIEAGFVALEGTLIGSGLALLTIFNIATNTDVFGDMRFTVPWVSLLVLLAGTLAASLAATLGPTVSASRIRPAVALRITD